MSEAFTLSQPAVVALPTAAPTKVRQPNGYARRDRREAAIASGVVVPSPAEYIAPFERRSIAAQEAKRELYAAGGLVRNAQFALLSALIVDLEPVRLLKLLDRLETLSALCAGPSFDAAAALVRDLAGDLPNATAIPPSEA